MSTLCDSGRYPPRFSPRLGSEEVGPTPRQSAREICALPIIRREQGLKILVPFRRSDRKTVNLNWRREKPVWRIQSESYIYRRHPIKRRAPSR